MGKPLRVLRLGLLTLLLGAAPADEYEDLLERAVSHEGVDLDLLRAERDVLDRYLETLAAADPPGEGPARTAFLLNAHNAAALRAVLEGKPVQHARFQEDDPRLRVAAADLTRNGPLPLRELYRAEDLDEQLTTACRIFLGDERRNRFVQSKLTATLSPALAPLGADAALGFAAAYVPRQSLAESLRKAPWRVVFEAPDPQIDLLREPPPAEPEPVSAWWIALYAAVAAALLAAAARPLRRMLAR